MGGFPVMEPVEQNTTGRQKREGEEGGQGRGMRKQGRGNGG